MSQDNTSHYEDEHATYVDADDFDYSTLSTEEFESYLQTGELPDRVNTDDENVDNKDSQQLENIDDPEDKISEEDSTDEPDENINEKPDTDTEEENTEKTELHSDKTTINYEEEYKKLFETPIKANGTDITLDNIDEVISLVQKGANYTQKMQALKPLRKYTEVLMQKQITQEDFNFLMDLHEGDKEAIKALVSKHKIDVLDLEDDSQEKKTYIPKNKTVDESTLEMNDVIDTIKASDYHSQIQTLINGGWDEVSVNELLSKPDVLKGLYEEFTLGRFDKINKLVVKDRLLKNDGKTDLARYVEYLLAENTSTDKQPVKKSDPVSEQNKPKAKLQSNKKSSIPANTSAVIENADEMSDEEYEKSFDVWFESLKKEQKKRR